MHTFKDKIIGFFIDSRSPSPPPPSDRSGARSPFSSFFSFLVGFGGSKSNKQQSDLRPTKSLPVGWIDKEFDLQDESFDSCMERSMSCRMENMHKLSEDYQQKSPLSDNKQTTIVLRSDEFEEAAHQKSPQKPLNNPTDDSAFITSDLYEFLGSSLPNIVKGRQWILLYSTLKHGTSLHTLIRNSAKLSGPCLLIVGDMKGAVFGGMLECPLKPTPRRKYQGTHQTFVFTTIDGGPRLFRPTGANRYYYICLNDLLALGGGSNFALCLDGDLLNGTSGPSETFGNICLAHTEEFELKNVELWGFKHASQYLT
ncbi:hypothetical protein SLE2022_167410 [Rubroshorea leprosula]